jgi:hypothetical protein
MLNQILNVIMIVVVLTPITSIMIFNNQSTSASSDDGRSIAPIYREGYEVVTYANHNHNPFPVHNFLQECHTPPYYIEHVIARS